MINYFLVSHSRSTTPENDLIPFLAGIGLLVGYLIFSAATEMGTKLPWKK